MTDIARLVIEADATGIKSASSELARFAQQGKATEDAFSKFSSNTSRGFDAVSGAVGVLSVALAGLKIGQLISDATALSQRYSELGIVMQAVGKNAGLSADEIERTAQAVQKSGISMVESRSVVAKLISANVDLANATKLARAAQDAAVVGQMNSSAALEQMIHGITSAQVEVLRTIGINVNFEQSYKRLADELGVTTAQLSEHQKMQARLNVTLEAAAGNAGVYEASLSNAGKMMRSTDRLVDDLKTKLGGLFDTVALFAVTQYSNALKSLNSTIDELRSSGSLERWGDNVARVFAFIADSANAVISLFKFVGGGLATLVQQAAALSNLDFSRVKQLDIEFSRMLTNEAKGLTKNRDLLEEQINQRKRLAEEAKKTAGIRPDKPQASEPSGSVSVTAKAISESQRFIDSLKKQAEQTGKTSTEILRLQAAHLGVSKQTAAHIDAIEQYNIAQEDGRRLDQQQADDLRRIAQITDNTRTAQERYNASIAELERLLEKGLDWDTFDRELSNIEKRYIEASKAGKDAFDEMSQFAIQAQRNLQNALGDALFDGISGKFDSMVDGFERAIKQMLAQALAADIWGTLFNKRTGNMAGILGSFGMAGNASASSGSSAGMMDIASMGADLFSVFNSGASDLFSKFAMSGMGESLGLSAKMGGSGMPFLTNSGLSGASAAGPVMAAIAASFIGKEIGTMIGGDKKLGGLSSSATSTIGAIFGGPLGGIIGGSLNGLFGRGPIKQKETNLIGDFTADGFSGITSTKFKAQGGAFRGDKVDRVMTDTDTGRLLDQFGELVEGGISKVLDPFAEQAREYSLKLGQYLDASISGMSKSLQGMAETLGFSSGALDDFSMSINIASEKGKMLTDEQIAQVIADAGDAMARHLIPGIETLSKSGETAFSTLQRLSGEFGVLTNLGTALGNSLSATRGFLSNVSFQDRTAFVDGAGGVDALASKVQFFFDNFLTGAEQLEPSIELLNEEMGKLGLSTDMSKAQFKELVQSFGHVGGVSESMLQSLLNLAPLFVRVKDAMNTTAEATYDLAAAEDLIADKRSALIAAYGREKSALESVVSRFKDLSANLRGASDSLSLSSLSPLTPQQRLDEARNQFNRDRLLANTGDQEALRRLPESGKAFLEASQIFNASSAEFVSDFNFVKGVLDSAAAVADTEADIAQRQLTELESTVGKLVDINDSVGDVETAIQDLTKAVLQGSGNPNITDQQIRDFVNTPGRTNQDIINAAVNYGISADQFSNATGTSLSAISTATGGASLSDAQIKDFFWQNISNPKLIYDTAKQYGISLSRVASASGYSFTDLEQWVKANNLPMFERGTDFVQKGGLAMLHPAEAVTPASHMKDMAQEIKALRQELAELRREQNQQTGALINVAMESSRVNANMINQHNQEIARSSAWREQSKAGIR